MSLTPDEWRELDELELVCRQPVPSWKGDRDNEWLYDAHRRQRLAQLVGEHLRTLIDAARPKCQKCKGRCEIQISDWWRGLPCPDCNGTGWA